MKVVSPPNVLHTTSNLQFISVDLDITRPSGAPIKWYYVTRNVDEKKQDVVVIVPQTTDGKYVLIKQYRAPFRDYIIEFPAGKVDDNESVLDAAKRELMEEVGYRILDFRISRELATSPGLTDETIHIVECRVEKATNQPKREITEDMSIILARDLNDATLQAGICMWCSRAWLIMTRLYNL